MPLPDKFFRMPVAEQCRILYLEGEFVTAIRYYKFKVNLYSLGDSLVEVFYNHKLDKIHSIKPLDYSSSRINFYADQVSIGELMPIQDGK